MSILVLVDDVFHLSKMFPTKGKDCPITLNIGVKIAKPQDENPKENKDFP